MLWVLTVGRQLGGLHPATTGVGFATLDQLHVDGASVRLVVCDLSTSPHVDVAGAHMLERLSNELTARKPPCASPTPTLPHATYFARWAWTRKVGGINRSASVADVVDEFLAEPTRLERPA